MSIEKHEFTDGELERVTAAVMAGGLPKAVRAIEEIEAEHGFTLGRFTVAECVAMWTAVNHLDALWAADELRGKADGLGGAEYWRTSPAARLREMLGQTNDYSGSEYHPLAAEAS